MEDSITKDQILAMQAGIALDILVAEQVMGKKVYAGHTKSSSPQVLTTSEVPYYSTDISAAWKVVDWMFSNGWLRQRIIRSMDGVWSVCFGLTGTFVDADNAPEAICKAALVAKIGQA